MAYSPSEKYPGAVDVDPDYQGGKFRDNNPSTTNNGSPLKAIDRNELLARDEAIMNDAGFKYNGLPDTPDDSQLFKAYKASLGNGANLLSNHNFLIQTPDDSQPLPSATPASYPPGYQIFSGVFANETTGITNLTYIDGRVSWSGGDLYFAVPNAGGIERLTSDQLTASVADFDGKPRSRGVSFSLVGDEYRITVTTDALEDVSAVLTPLGSVKFEQGSVATGHLVSEPDKVSTIALVEDALKQLLPVNSVFEVEERGCARFKVVHGGISDGYGVIDAGGGNTAVLVVDASKGVGTVDVGIKNENADNHLRLEAASAIAVTNKTFINPNHKDVCNMSETPSLSAPISSDRPERACVFEQSDNSKSVLSFTAGMDFFHMKGFWARFENDLQAQTAPAIFLTDENHNAKLSHIHTTGGTYGIHSDQVSFWQSYEHCRCDNYNLAQIRVDGDRNDLSGGGTTINITNCGGFSSKTTEADAALVLNSIGEVNIRTYESGQGKMKSLIVANSVFNLNIDNWHWELSEITQNGLNLSNCAADVDGLYMQDIKIPSGSTLPLVLSFKSTVQIANIVKRGTEPDGALKLLTGSQANVMNSSNICMQLSGRYTLDNLTVDGTYVDVQGDVNSITSSQLMLVDASKIRTFNILQAVPNSAINFPYNGSKPTWMEGRLGGVSQGVSPIFDGSSASVISLSGGSPNSAASFQYRWTNASGSVDPNNIDIQVIAHYPNGWYELN